MEDRVQQLEKEVAMLKEIIGSQILTTDRFNGLDVVRKNWKHAGDKIGFFSADPVVQQTDMGALTDNTGSTPDSTIAQVSGSGADSTINDNFSDLADKVNDIRTVLSNLGLIA